MASHFKAPARTNLSSGAKMHLERRVGDGTFRDVFAGTFVGGTRNNQPAVCKKFKRQYKRLQEEFFATDARIQVMVVKWAERWNEVCRQGREVVVNCGTVHRTLHGTYMVEPFIPNFTKWTSNSGYIMDYSRAAQRDHDAQLAMEAFTHYT